MAVGDIPAVAGPAAVIAAVGLEAVIVVAGLEAAADTVVAEHTMAAAWPMAVVVVSTGNLSDCDILLQELTEITEVYRRRLKSISSIRKLNGRP